MTRARFDPVRRTMPLGAVCAALLAVVACDRADEADLRARLADWVPLGETLVFDAARGCAAGMFELRGPRIGARLRIASSAREAAMALRSGSTVAIAAPRLSPDTALTALANESRAAGMRMRVAALEARACMNTEVEAAFAAALVDPHAAVLMDVEAGILALMQSREGVLIVAMGAE